MKNYITRITISILIIVSFSSAVNAQNIDIDWTESINHIDAGKGFDSSMKFISVSASYIEVGSVVGLGLFMDGLKKTRRYWKLVL